MSCLAAAIALCTGLTAGQGYVVDGDTIRTDDGVYIRLLELDTPEKGYRADCDAERMLAEYATLGLVKHLAKGFRVEPVGFDRYGRILAHLRLPAGRTASQAQITAGLGVPYMGRVHDWCMRNKV